MYLYSCYACSIVDICKYCVCPQGPYGLLDVGIKVSICYLLKPKYTDTGKVVNLFSFTFPVKEGDKIYNNERCIVREQT